MNALLGAILQELKDHLDIVCKNTLTNHKSCGALESLYNRYAKLHELSAAVNYWVCILCGCLFVYILLRHDIAKVIHQVSCDESANEEDSSLIDLGSDKIATHNDSDISESIGESDVIRSSSSSDEETSEEDN